MQNLQKVADRLGVRVSKGLSSTITQAMFGPVKESRRPYIEALATSDIVTLEEIDRILHTRYSRLPEDTRGLGFKPKSAGTLADVFSIRRTDAKQDRFYTLDSLFQHILNNYVTRSDLQKICQNLGISGTGNKGDLIARVLGDSRLTPEAAIYYVRKDDMKKLCVDMNLSTTGTRRDMESRVVNVMARLPRALRNDPAHDPQQYASPLTPPLRAVSNEAMPQSILNTARPAPLQGHSAGAKLLSYDQPITRSETGATLSSSPPSAPESAPIPSIPPHPELYEVIKFIEEWRPTMPYRDEREYEVELDTRLRARFGEEDVKKQRHVLDGRIDIEVMGIGIEIKVPTNKAMLQRLVGQARMYRKHYGPNLVVVIITGKVKLQDVLAFKSDLEEDDVKTVIKSG